MVAYPRIFQLFCVFFFGLNLFGQSSIGVREQNIIDSVFNALDTIELDVDKTMLLHRQANYLYDFAPFTKVFLDSALQIAMANQLADEIAITYLNLMQFHVINASTDSADWYYRKAMDLQIVKENPIHRSDFLMLRATILKNQGNMKGAIEYFLNALTTLEQPGLADTLTTESKSILHNNLANLYKDLKDFPSAVKHYDQSYHLLISLDEKAFAGTVLMNKAGLYYDYAIYDTAYQIQLLAKKFKEEGAASDRSIAMSDLNIGNALVGLGRYEQAKPFIDGALANFLKMENPHGLTSAYIARGDLHMKIGDLKAAVADCEKGSLLAEAAGVLDLQQKACDCLFMAYKRTGNYLKSLQNHELLKLLSDSLRNDANTKYITQIEMQYSFDKAEEQRLTEEMAALILQDEKDQRNRRAFTIMVLLLIGSLFVGYLIYRNYQIKKKSEAELAKKNDIISKALQDKDLLLREIHHRVKNNLQVISSLLRLQSRYVDDDAALNAISAGRNRVHSMALLHENLYQDDNFTAVNMQKYFDRLIEGLFSTLNIDPGRIALVKEIAPIDLDIDSVVPLGLITNELITNALKHAFSDQLQGILKVHLYEQDDRLHLEVSDNGKGMATDFFENKSTSFGHKLIKAFAAKLHAELKILNDGGTRVQLTIKDYRKAS